MSPAGAPLYLIDGSSYVYRAFFALPPLTTPSGAPVNAVYGFTTMVLKLIREVTPRYLAVIFDAPGATFRDELYEAYKAHRPRMPDDLAAQLSLVHEVVEALQVRMLHIGGVEADDVIATLTTRYSAEGVDCVVITADKDLMQLVGPHVRLWDTMRDRWVDEAAVQERFGVEPAQVPDVMALMGDASDNIPGVKGIGEKTATAVIRHFGSLESLLARIDEVESLDLRGAKKVAALLRQSREVARLSRELALVRRDVPLDVTLDDLRYAGPDHTALRALFSRLGFQSLVRDLTDSAPPVAVASRALVTTAEVAAFHGRVRLTGTVALAAVGSVPADGLPPTVRAEAVVLATSEASECPVSVSLDESTRLEAVREILGDPTLEVVAHDLKREMLRLGPSLPIAGAPFDTMVASYLLDATATHRLEDLAADVLGVKLPEFRAGVDGAAAGAARLPRLAEELSARLDALGMTALFRDIEMPLVEVLTAIERRGVRIDTGALADMSRELQGRLDVLMAEIYELAGGEFNINSPPQLRTVLFDRLGLSKKGVRRGKTGYSTDVDVLTRLASEHPVPAKILEYRGLSKLKSTYVDALPAAVNPQTRRLHTSFNQTVAVTGRLSSSNPNLQNIPARGEEARRIRAAFVAEPGHVVLSADYSQIELRVLAHLAEDPTLIEAFRTGADIHTRTAAEMFGVLPGTVSADMRRAAKVINFGIIYGMGAQRLSQELGISLGEAQRYIERYFSRYAAVRGFLDATIATARQCGYVTTLSGRRRAVPDLNSGDRGLAQAAERTATNTPIQGTAADIIKIAMVALQRRLEADRVQAFMTLQVHDELVFEVAEAQTERASEIIRAEMEGAMSLRVPLKVDIGHGRNWAEAHT
ncbi:MAG TPA: DNA polymerase I [Candidatus Binatia bacterium]|nr:DNA polymerase I [Candidatus Binatia bacterium]